jgi:hypothetical protein
MRNLFAFLLAAALLAPGCGSNTTEDPADAEEFGDHAHAAMFGGELLELGEHQANLEFVADTVEGRVSVYVLDAHAENTMRLTDESLPAELMVGGEVIPITLNASENALTGETIGDSAQFTAKHEAIVGAESFSLRLPAITVRGLPFKNITWTFGK